ncbi:hypothetical protein F503_01035 [Ophiostoma piceae UAMH 11346]|uniref:Uncharacterized protein n=1 Tax=Ophiostoma piceae (strain UAMH 11346) TaxID=1262450 RepID=S3C651_OPHP1|nr:hypothetical protein F503_01035 [Ophiostoma piceae UAMH 11346]
MSPPTGTAAMSTGASIDGHEAHQYHLLSNTFEHLNMAQSSQTSYDNGLVHDDLAPIAAGRPQAHSSPSFTDIQTPRGFGSNLALPTPSHGFDNAGHKIRNQRGLGEQGAQMWPSKLDSARRYELEDPSDESAFWAPSLSEPLASPHPPAEPRIADIWQTQRNHQHPKPSASDMQTTGALWLPRAMNTREAESGFTPTASYPPPSQTQHHSYLAQRHHSYAEAFPTSFPLPAPNKAFHNPRSSLPSEKLALYREPTQPSTSQNHPGSVHETHSSYSPPTMSSSGLYLTSEASPVAWSLYGHQDPNSGAYGHEQKHITPSDTTVARKVLGQKDSNSSFSTLFQFPAQRPAQNEENDTSTSTAAPAKTFKPMQMVFRERNRRASASSTGTSSSSGGSGSPTTLPTYYYHEASVPSPLPFVLPTLSYPSPPSSAIGTPSRSLTRNEQAFRRQQGISLNYRGDIHNPHNRGDHVPTHTNTSLFLMGLPPNTSIGGLLRAIAMLGPTGRIFAASVNPPDPTRRLPLAAAKVSYFTRAQAEQLKALVDSQQLVMYAEDSPAPHVVRCSWNRDKKAPRRCVQASECRVLRIRGPRDVVNFTYLTAYFEGKFRYDLQDVQVVAHSQNESGGRTSDEQTMEWRFASFQSQAIAAKMALNQERKMVRVEYGRDPCEWGEY